MSWAIRKLDEIADFQLGKMLDDKKNKGDPLPYLANLNVRWGEFELKDLRLMRFQTAELERFSLKYGDIVMCEGGEPGRCAIWKEQLPKMMYQKALHRIRPREGVDHQFLYYAFLFKGKQGGFSPLFTGSTIKHLPKEKLAKVEVEIPDLSEQQRIAYLLSKYDDLIENNKRRIELLEESARLLYKEWFVRFRFPGHEHVKIIDGVPEGWVPKTLSEIVTLVKDTVDPKSISEMTPYIGLEHLPRRSLTLNIWESAGKVSSSKFAFKCGDILFGKIRPYFHKVGFALVDGITSSDAVVLRPNLRKHYCIALSEVTTDAFVALASKTVREGSKMPRADWGVLKSRAVLEPPEAILNVFNNQIECILNQCKLLSFQNFNLIKARDILLPKLMSGEIAV
jgi:type I restriction enzyme S subunit